VVEPTPPKLPGLVDPRLLASGGVADVYTYRRLTDASQVVVKISAWRDGVETASRLQNEAEILEQVQTVPGVVRLDGWGVTDNAQTYLVLEHCLGPSWGQLFDKPVDPVNVLRLASSAAKLLDRLHQCGVVHRDISPNNWVIQGSTVVRLIDFGSAATVGSVGPVGHTALWAAPELLQEPQKVDPQSDLYSLAALLYAVWAGHAPFQRIGTVNAPGHLRWRGASNTPPTLPNQAPPGLDAVLNRALDPQVTARYPSAAVFAEVLENLAKQLSGSSWPGSSAKLLAKQTAEETATDLSQTVRRSDSVKTNRLAGHAGLASFDQIGAVEQPEAITQDVLPIVFGSQQPPQPEPSQAVPGDITAAPSFRLGKLIRRRTNSAAKVVVAALTIVGLALICGLIWANLRSSGSLEQPATTISASGAPIDLGDPVPAPLSLTATPFRANTPIVFTWINPDPQAGDKYAITYKFDNGPVMHEQVSQPRFAVTVKPGVSLICLDVAIVRESLRVTDQPSQICLSTVH
jgi:serine/threonine protein kinase